MKIYIAFLISIFALPAYATPITVDIDLADWTNNPTDAYGDNMSVTLTMDNGGVSLTDQTWAATDISSITAFIDGINVYEWTSSTSTFNSSAGTELLNSDSNGTVSLILGNADGIGSNYINTGNELGRIQFYNAQSVGTYEYLAYLDVYSFAGDAKSGISGSFSEASASVPAPATLALILLGLSGLMLNRKSRLLPIKHLQFRAI